MGPDSIGLVSLEEGEIWREDNMKRQNTAIYKAKERGWGTDPSLMALRRNNAITP